MKEYYCTMRKGSTTSSHFIYADLPIEAAKIFAKILLNKYYFKPGEKASITVHNGQIDTDNVFSIHAVFDKELGKCVPLLNFRYFAKSESDPGIKKYYCEIITGKKKKGRRIKASSVPEAIHKYLKVLIMRQIDIASSFVVSVYQSTGDEEFFYVTWKFDYECGKIKPEVTTMTMGEPL